MWVRPSEFWISIMPLNISVQQSSLMSIIVAKCARVCVLFSLSVFYQKCIFPKCIFAKCTQLACLPSFASLLCPHVSGIRLFNMFLTSSSPSTSLSGVWFCLPVWECWESFSGMGGPSSPAFQMPSKSGEWEVCQRSHIVVCTRWESYECRYVTPLDAGYSTEFLEESLADHIYPTGRSLLINHLIFISAIGGPIFDI